MNLKHMVYDSRCVFIAAKLMNRIGDDLDLVIRSHWRSPKCFPKKEGSSERPGRFSNLKGKVLGQC